MATINNLITECAVKFKEETGKTPHNVYLGRVEIEALKRWAYEDCYRGCLDVDQHYKKNRPVVEGLIVYVVDDITHLECA